MSCEREPRSARSWLPRRHNIPRMSFSTRTRRAGLTLVTVLLSSVVVLVFPSPTRCAQEAPKQADAGSRYIEAARADPAPGLDGSLGDPEWRHATIVSDFRQREPFFIR